MRRRDSRVAYLVAGSSNHTTYSRCSDELDVLSMVREAHPDMAITLHRWDQARLRSDHQVDADGRSRFAEMGGQKSSKGPFTRIAWVGSVETPFVPLKDKYASLFKSAGP